MNEEDIRSLLRETLVKEFAPKRIHLISELGLNHGNCRVDLAVVSPGDLYGFEIKSEEDNLRRLPWQVRYYSQVLDYASVVVAPKHVEGVTPIIPSWWGIFVVSKSPFSSRIRVRCLRLPKRNPKIDFYGLVSMMWKGDAVEFLEKRGEGKSWRRRAKWHLWKRIQETCSEDEVREFIRERLVARISMESVRGWKCLKKKRKGKRRRRRGRRRRGRWMKRGRGKYQPY